MNSINYYDQNSQQYYDRTIAIDMTDKYENFLSHLPHNAHILDAGCGVGRDALYFKKLGHHVKTFDGSAEMVRLSSILLKQTTEHLTFQEMNFENEFDAVWAGASLLHVPYDDMGRVFEKIHRSLKNSGLFFASFKYGNQKRFVDTRTFYDMDEEIIQPYLKGLFETIDFWKTFDEGQAQNISKAWFNILCRKVN